MFFEEGRGEIPEGREGPEGGHGWWGVRAAGPAVRQHRRNGRSPFARRRAAGGLRPGFCGLQGAAGGGKPPIG